MPQISITGTAGSVFVEAEEITADGARPVSRGVIKEVSQEELAHRFADVLGFIRKTVGEHAPDTFEVELSLAVTTEGNFLIVRGDASASLKLKAKWEK